MDKLMSESGVNLALLCAVLWENILSIRFCEENYIMSEL
jgi:hypothetical protein